MLNSLYSLKLVTDDQGTDWFIDVCGKYGFNGR
jgi:hypothetical protein